MPSVKVTYENGESADADARPIHTVLAERKWGTEIGEHRVEAAMFVAWLALKRPGPNGETTSLDPWNPDEKFEAWLESLEEWDIIEDVTPADPTTAGPSTGAS